MRTIGNLTISGSLQTSGSITATTFIGDGSGLVGVTSYTDSDTLDYINSIGVVSGSVNWDTLSGKPANIVSSSAQLSTEISGAFTSTSASFASDIQNNDTRLSTLEGKTLVSSSAQISYTGITDIPNGIVSSSAQLSTEISGAFASVSASIASDIANISTDFADITNKPTLISSSLQVDYNSIQNQPTIPTNNNQLTNGAGYCTTDTTYTANDMLTCVKTVDGAGSGLDADLLDGNQASAFYLASNPSGYTTCTGTVTGTGTSGYISKWNGSTSQTNSIIYDNGTNVGIGTTSPAEKLHVVGNIVATGNITGYYSSDERLKENKEVLKNSIEKINKISGYEFDWKEIPSYGVPKHDVGVIAQEIEEVLPEIVARREDGYLAVRYEKIVPLLIEGIKELSKEVESLKDIIKNNGITK